MSSLTTLTLICGAVVTLWAVCAIGFLWLVAAAPDLPDPDGESL